MTTIFSIHHWVPFTTFQKYKPFPVSRIVAAGFWLYNTGSGGSWDSYYLFCTAPGPPCSTTWKRAASRTRVHLPLKAMTKKGKQQAPKRDNIKWCTFNLFSFHRERSEVSWYIFWSLKSEKCNISMTNCMQYFLHGLKIDIMNITNTTLWMV